MNQHPVNRIAVPLAMLLAQVVATSAASAGPIVALEKVHGPFHLGAGFSTTHEFYDTNNASVVRGAVTNVTREGERGPITAFTVQTIVFNDSGVDWLNYVFAFEYAQHSRGHWAAEYDLMLTPQPVIVPTQDTVYTQYFVPGHGMVNEVPAVLRRGGLRNRGTDRFDTSFVIEGVGAAVNSNLFNFLLASLNAPNEPLQVIHWARQTSQDISDYPQPLASGLPPGGILTEFDRGAGGPAGNTGPPGHESNVSVFPTISVPEPNLLFLFGVGVLALARRRAAGDKRSKTSLEATSR